MRSSLDCVPCFTRQALVAARAVSSDPAVHESVIREMLLWIGESDLSQSPPAFAQHIHRRLRAITSNHDLYRAAKDRHNQMALRLLPGVRALIDEAPHPLGTALSLAVAGNAIDMGVASDVNESDLSCAIDQALQDPLEGELGEFERAVQSAGRILFLADNAGEIAFDRLLIEQLGPSRVTLAVRGAPVLNDATLVDAQAVGLDEIVELIDNGSDAPGTILVDCSQEFRRRFAQSDLVIAKGQGNFESLSEEPHNVFFLFRVKCQVIADQVGKPVGTHLVTRSSRGSTRPGGST